MFLIIIFGVLAYIAIGVAIGAFIDRIAFNDESFGQFLIILFWPLSLIALLIIGYIELLKLLYDAIKRK